MSDAALDMKDFLEDIQTCCNGLSLSWGSAKLDPDNIRQFKRAVEEGLVKNKDTIMSFYSFAKGKGQYVLVRCFDTYSALAKYEEYHDDLYNFIRSMLSDDKDQNVEELTRHAAAAIKMDKKFRENLFSGGNEKVAFSEALENMNVLMYLHTFIDKVNDSFIYLRGKQQESAPRTQMLIDLYANSVCSFLDTIVDQVCANINEMKDVMNGKFARRPVDSTYRLI